MRRIKDSDDGLPPPPQLSPKAVLRHNYLFRGLSDATLDGIAALSAKRTYYKGSVIFAQGGQGDALFGVASGRVRISASASGGHEVFLNIMEPGDTFGEIAVMDGLPRTANADRARHVDVDHHPARRLPAVPRARAAARDSPAEVAVRTAAMDERARRGIRVHGRARTARETTADSRVVARPRGRRWQLELRISQGELARFLGMSRQIVNHHLSDWRRNGWIDLGRTQIVIRNTEAFRVMIAEGTKI